MLFIAMVIIDWKGVNARKSDPGDMGTYLDPRLDHGVVIGALSVPLPVSTGSDDGGGLFE